MRTKYVISTKGAEHRITAPHNIKMWEIIVALLVIWPNGVALGTIHWHTKKHLVGSGTDHAKWCLKMGYLVAV